MSSKRFSLRLAIQISFAAITAFFVFAPFIISERSWAEELCPLGGLETLPYLIKSGVYLKHISSFNIGIMTALIIVTLIFGRVFCSYVCPLGSIQEWFGSLGKKLGLRKEMPENLDKSLTKLKYIILTIILFATYTSAHLVFRPYDPFYALFHLYKPAINASFVILGLSLVGSMFISRIWCRYLCPLGALVNFLSFFSLIKPVRNEADCINCNLCSKACPENVMPSKQLVFSKEGCTHCLDCIDACPATQNAINLVTSKPTKFIKKPGGSSYGN